MSTAHGIAIIMPRFWRVGLRLPALVSQAAFALQLLVSYGSATFNGNALFPHSIGDISSMHETRLAAARFAFPVAWGIIYFLQLLYIFRSFISSERRFDLDVLFPISCLLNSSWVILWTHDLIQVALGVFVLLWITLFLIHIRLNFAKPPMPDFWNYLTLQAPFSLYFGWVTFAINGNIAAAVETFTISDVVTAAAIVTMLSWLALASSMDVAFCISLLWGFIAVLVRASSRDDKDLEFVMVIAITSVFSAVGVRVWTHALRNLRRRPLGSTFLLNDRGAPNFVSMGPA